ncbi:MFS general substrate transporter [Trametes versicolor FP-101664 SS1]|uniref:MFS general substrate transporter n=1 Tax=Trametes versicolor (strain FP-101664) TaxID=717944 RepID=UPI0004622CD8|nr:MFS general substrate transporter [Trametes versicolor FP-101664 SS1]EIW55071.1 MFS general substrate transporter [Trametes versicolor FP-101664 SS1]
MSQAQPSIPSTPMAGSGGATTPINEKGDSHSAGGSKEPSISDVVQLPELEDETGVRTPAQRRKAFMQFAALCCSIFVSGWNDGTLGPLLPRLQEVYDVGYAVVSLIFVVSCIGAILGSCTFLYLTDRLGYGVVVVLASLMMMVAYALEAAAVPFPVFVVAYFFIGFGNSFLNSGSNVFLANVSVGKASTRFGILHGSYGLGAMASPLISTQFSHMRHWSFVYLVHIGLLVITVTMQTITFKFQSQEACALEIGLPPPAQEPVSLLERYKRVFRMRAVHLMALFAFIYVGIEVSIGSWIVTYVIDLRHGGPSSGYISSGLFGGIMVGRIALLPISKLIGDRRAIFVYILAVIGLELVVWLVPSLIADAIAVSFVGFFLGPMMPIMTNHSARILPPDLISGGVGWIASWGAAGAAVYPFVTGAIASKTGIGALQPLVVALSGVLFVVWGCVPRSRKQIQG